MILIKKEIPRRKNRKIEDFQKRANLEKNSLITGDCFCQILVYVIRLKPDFVFPLKQQQTPTKIYRTDVYYWSGIQRMDLTTSKFSLKLIHRY